MNTEKFKQINVRILPGTIGIAMQCFSWVEGMFGLIINRITRPPKTPDTF